jgi:hypothetical protein
MDSTGFQRGLDRMNTGMRGLAGSAQRIGGMLGVGLGVAGIVQAVRSVIQFADELQDTAEITGLTVSQVNKLAESFINAGGKEERLTQALVQLRRAQGEVIAQNPKMTQAFAQLGMSGRDVAGMEMEDMLLGVARGFATAEDKATAFNAIAEIFGTRVAGPLSVILADLAKNGFGELNKGLDESAAKLSRYADMWSVVGRNVKIFGATVIGEVGKFFERGGAFWGAVSAVGWKEAMRQSRAGELEDVLTGKPKVAGGADDKEAERLARQRAYDANRKAITDRFAEKRADLMMKGAGGQSFTSPDQLAQVGLGVGNAMSPSMRLAEAQLRVQEKLLEINKEEAKALARIDGKLGAGESAGGLGE